MCKKSFNELKINRRTFDRLNKKFEKIILNPPKVIKSYYQVILDAVFVSKDSCYLIASDGKYPITWLKCKTENAKLWVDFLRKIPPPKFAVCDGQRGLTFGLDLCWNQTKVQRCQFHVMLNCRQKLTLKPMTEMGRELKYLVSLITQTNSFDKVKAWGEYLFSLGEKYKKYLSERTYQENGKWEYTHRRDRSCYYQLTRLFNSGDLFRCITEFCFNISKITNSLEGGINSRIKDLIRRHRGCSEYTKSRIVEFYLITRTKDYSFEKLSRLFV